MRSALKRTWRTYATTTTPFVPPASLPPTDRPPRRPLQKAKPESPTFYTGRSDYYDEVTQLENAIGHARRALRTLELLPLPAFARDSLPPAQKAWRSRIDMSGLFMGALTTARYRRIITLLNELEEYARIANTAGHRDLGGGIVEVLQVFERSDKNIILDRGRVKPAKFDNFGRTYTVGKRKESTARVWMIPVQQEHEPVAERNPLGAYSLEPVVEDPLKPAVVDKPRVKVTTTTVLVNNLPINAYFVTPADRERVIRPLKLAGALGAFNIFVLVRGGGTTGQSGAVAHGIAKGVVAHLPDVEMVLRRSKMLRRDPRMVERKKTGQAKARKRYAWVKR
ncbi:ribosomal protein S5 domain 2-like protein [Auriscalpium vulgare]|uniref:Ribosomal protein S5 domain 2-like protein n=1 Tax=Auriscalpium vulgare TaxID=40419 RepID=A0ACB8RXD3_9AGAM|nr:ribosomal protein S5 domain 2-like protein [Auriscalpium vulgare]